MKNQNKQWKPVVGYEGLYEVSEDGEVFSVQKQKIRKLTITPRGYLRIQLCKNGLCKIYFVHRLVAIAFIDNKFNKKEVNHIDGIKTNNTISNLEWCTRQENAIHSWDNGLQKITLKNRITASLNLKKLKSKMVVDLHTGVFYDSLKIACIHTNRKYNATYFNTVNNTKKQRFKFI